MEGANRQVADRFVVPMKLGHSGGEKEFYESARLQGCLGFCPSRVMVFGFQLLAICTIWPRASLVRYG